MRRDPCGDGNFLYVNIQVVIIIIRVLHNVTIGVNWVNSAYIESTIISKLNFIYKK